MAKPDAQSFMRRCARITRFVQRVGVEVSELLVTGPLIRTQVSREVLNMGTRELNGVVKRIRKITLDFS